MKIRGMIYYKKLLAKINRLERHLDEHYPKQEQVIETVKTGWLHALNAWLHSPTGR